MGFSNESVAPVNEAVTTISSVNVSSLPMAATGSIDIAAIAWAVERRMRTSLIRNQWESRVALTCRLRRRCSGVKVMAGRSR